MHDPRQSHLDAVYMIIRVLCLLITVISELRDIQIQVGLDVLTIGAPLQDIIHLLEATLLLDEARSNRWLRYPVMKQNTELWLEVYVNYYRSDCF